MAPVMFVVLVRSKVPFSGTTWQEGYADTFYGANNILRNTKLMCNMMKNKTQYLQKI
jgi:hypothetical protein